MNQKIINKLDKLFSYKDVIELSSTVKSYKNIENKSKKEILNIILGYYKINNIYINKSNFKQLKLLLKLSAIISINKITFDYNEIIIDDDIIEQLEKTNITDVIIENNILFIDKLLNSKIESLKLNNVVILDNDISINKNSSLEILSLKNCSGCNNINIEKNINTLEIYGKNKFNVKCKFINSLLLKNCYINIENSIKSDYVSIHNVLDLNFLKNIEHVNYLKITNITSDELIIDNIFENIVLENINVKKLIFPYNIKNEKIYIKFLNNNYIKETNILLNLYHINIDKDIYINALKKHIKNLYNNINNNIYSDKELYYILKYIKNCTIYIDKFLNMDNSIDYSF